MFYFKSTQQPSHKFEMTINHKIIYLTYEIARTLELNKNLDLLSHGFLSYLMTSIMILTALAYSRY